MVFRFTTTTGYPSRNFLKTTVVLPLPVEPSHSTSSQRTPLSHPRAYERLKGFLKPMLKSMIDRLDSHPDEPVHPVIKELGPAETVNAFRQQLESFWRNEWPFNQAISDSDRNSLAWWKSLELHPQARVLAVSLTVLGFHSVVTIMIDFRHQDIFDAR
jgi:hypothetical protein